MPGATARLLLRDLRRCAQFAGATMRTFAPGTFESPSPRLPRSVAPPRDESGDAGDADEEADELAAAEARAAWAESVVTSDQRYVV